MGIQIKDIETGNATIMIGEQGQPITDVQKDQAFNSLEKSGALLLRGFDVDLGSFSEFVGKMCSKVTLDPARTFFESNVQKVDAGTPRLVCTPKTPTHLSRRTWCFSTAEKRHPTDHKPHCAMARWYGVFFQMIRAACSVTTSCEFRETFPSRTGKNTSLLKPRDSIAPTKSPWNISRHSGIVYPTRKSNCRMI